MNGIEPQQLLYALTTLVILLFVAAGSPFARRWQRQLRTASVIAFIIALLAAVIDIAVWLWGF